MFEIFLLELLYYFLVLVEVWLANITYTFGKQIMAHAILTHFVIDVTLSYYSY